MPALPTGLQRHPKSGTYYLRRRIPTDLLTCYPGKKEVIHSLKTKDYRTALERHRQGEAELTYEWHLHRQKMAREFRQQGRAEAAQQGWTPTCIDNLTASAISSICSHYESASLAGDERRRSNAGYCLEDVRDSRQGYAEVLETLKDAMATQDVEMLRQPLDEFLRLYRYQINASPSEMSALLLEFGHTLIRTNENLLQRFNGQRVPTPAAAQHADTPRLSEVTTAYLEYYEKLEHSAMLRKVRSVMPLLVALVGDKSIGTLKQSDFEHFFEAIQQLPPRWKDVCRQRGISPSELAKLKIGEISKGTFDGTYLAAMTPFLKYCRRKWQDAGWPMNIIIEGVQYLGSRKESEMQQRPFKQSELQRLFNSDDMRAFTNDRAQAHKFWLPHVGLFTGARVNEICQLNPQVDIREEPETNIWYLDITDESAGHADVDKTVKTAGSKRRVPIHSKLIELGFLDYVDDLRKGGHVLLFPGFEPKVRKASPEAAEWFIEFMRKIGLRDETPGARLVGMHAFRSTLLHWAMRLEVVNAEAITGHTSNITNLRAVQDGQIGNDASSVVKGYRGELPLLQKRAILERITYEGLVLRKPTYA